VKETAVGLAGGFVGIQPTSATVANNSGPNGILVVNNGSIHQLWLDQESIRDDQSQYQTMIADNVDILTQQLTGVVGDFTTLGDDVHHGFQNWSRDAIQTVVTEVLAIHRPHIDTIRGHISRFRPCTW